MEVSIQGGKKIRLRIQKRYVNKDGKYIKTAHHTLTSGGERACLQGVSNLQFPQQYEIVIKQQWHLGL